MRFSVQESGFALCMLAESGLWDEQKWAEFPPGAEFLAVFAPFLSMAKAEMLKKQAELAKAYNKQIFRSVSMKLIRACIT